MIIMDSNIPVVMDYILLSDIPTINFPKSIVQWVNPIIFPMVIIIVSIKPIHS